MLGCNRASAAAALIEQVSRVVSVIAIASHKRYNRSIHPRLRNRDANTAPLWPGADLQPATRVPLVQKRWLKATIRPAVSRNCGPALRVSQGACTSAHASPTGVFRPLLAETKDSAARRPTVRYFWNILNLRATFRITVSKNIIKKLPGSECLSSAPS